MSRLKWNPQGRKRIRKKLERLKEDASSVFYYETADDSRLVEFIMMPAVALKWNMENPLWCQVIGAPGSGKTAHLNLMEDWDKAKFVSRLSKNSLISGFRPGGDTKKDPSFITKLNGRLLVIKDFTCILQGPREERDAVIGQLRDTFDGRCSRVLGNIGFKEYASKFNILLAVTNVIDGFYSVNTQLGERFITRREYSKNRQVITQRAFENILGGHAHSKLGKIKLDFTQFLEDLPAVRISKIHWPAEMRKRAIAGADFIASCRSHVLRGPDGKSIASRPAPEVGTRLVTQIVQTVACYCILHGLTEVTADAWNFGGARILCDTLPVAISWVLNQIYEYTIICQIKNISTDFTIKSLLPLTRLGWHTTERIITDLYFNGILDATYLGKTGRRSTAYRLSQRAFEIIEGIGLLDSYPTENIDVESIVDSTHKQERFKHD